MNLEIPHTLGDVDLVAGNDLGLSRIVVTQEDLNPEVLEFMTASVEFLKAQRAVEKARTRSRGAKTKKVLGALQHRASCLKRLRKAYYAMHGYEDGHLPKKGVLEPV